MAGTLPRLTDVRPGERAQLLRAAAVLFCLIAGHTMLETTRDALFLLELPANQLAAVYAVLATFAILFTGVTALLARRFGRRGGLVITLLAGAYGTVAFYLLPKSTPVVFALYAFTGLLGSVAVAQFWMLASRWFTVAQGKRLFGLVAAGGVLGAVLGAAFAMVLLWTLAVEHLLVVGAAFQLIAAQLVTTTGSAEVDAPVASTSGRSARAGELRRQPYVVRLGGVVALSTATFLLLDYLFKTVAVREVPPSELPSFLAGYYAILSGLSLVVQLFVTGPLLGRLGILSALLVLPLLLGLGAMAILFTGGALAAVLAAKSVDGALRHSLHRVSTELLWTPVPDDLRAAAKPALDTVVVRGAQAITAAALFVVALVGRDDAQVLAGLMLATLVPWLVIGVRLRRTYVELFRSAIGATTHLRPNLELDLDTMQVVIESLSNRDPRRAVAAMELLVDNGRARLVPALVLYHEAPEVLVRALEHIATPDRQDWQPLAARLLRHGDEAVRVAALRALAAAGDEDAVATAASDDSPRVRGHAAALALLALPPGAPLVHPALDERKRLEQGPRRELELGLLEELGRAADPRMADVLLEVTGGLDDVVAEAAAIAVTRLADARFVPMLVERLAYRDGRIAVRQALVACGDVAFAALRESLVDPATPTRLRRHLPAALAEFGSQAAADVLGGALGREQQGRVRYRIIKALGHLVTERGARVGEAIVLPPLRATLVEQLRMLGLEGRLAPRVSADDGGAGKLLLELLGDKVRQAQGRALRLLALLHPSEDLKGIGRALGSPSRAIRAQAAEYLDALTRDSADPLLRRLFALTVDELPPAERLERARREVPTLLADDGDALEALMADRDATLAALAAYFAVTSGQRELEPAVAAVSRRPESKLLDRSLLDFFGRSPALAS